VHKQEHNGTEFCWCESCGRWSTTHHSRTHRHKAFKTTAYSILAFAGPAAWSVSLSYADLAYDLWDILGSHLIGCIFGACLVGLMHVGVTCVAPLLWGSVVWYFFWSLPQLIQLRTDPPCNMHRNQRRNKCRHKYHPGSIRDHGLHRQYP
jgi:hypothetical protein